MKVRRRRRIILAWLLFMAMMPFFVAKIAHRHDPGKVVCCPSGEDSADSHAQHPDHCLICNLLLTPFLATDSFDLHFIATLRPFERIDHPNGKVFLLSYSHYLRAPPAVC